MVTAQRTMIDGFTFKTVPYVRAKPDKVAEAAWEGETEFIKGKYCFHCRLPSPSLERYGERDGKTVYYCHACRRTSVHFLTGQEVKK